MSKMPSLLCFGIFYCIAAQAQQAVPLFSSSDPARASVSLARYPEPILMVGDHETRVHAFISDPEDVISFDMYKGKKARRKFGLKGKAGAIAVTLKPATPLARLPELFEAFQVTAQQQQLSLAINGQHVRNPEQLLADLRQIEKVEVTAFDPLSPTRWSLAPAFLNIVTKQQLQPHSGIFRGILEVQKASAPSTN
ncbi:hypothetical protein ACXYMU_03420 [Pontibacter sp. CAU 1760]